jgi:RNA polymerase sigma factor (sigma-70 family)
MQAKEKINSEKCFATKLKLLRKPLLKYTYCRVFNKDDAEDIVQDVLFILHSKMNENDSNKNFYNWAISICKFQIMGYLTRRSRSKIIFTENYEELNFALLNETCPALKLLSKEKSSVALKSSSLLNSIEKKVFLLCLQGFRPIQVMDKLKISRSNFSVSKSRALKKMKAHYSNKSLQNHKL